MSVATALRRVAAASLRALGNARPFSGVGVDGVSLPPNGAMLSIMELGKHDPRTRRGKVREDGDGRMSAGASVQHLALTRETMLPTTLSVYSYACAAVCLRDYV